MTDLRDQLQASLGQTYVIERELGGGGMSRVFLADDASLGRRLVVKVLPADLAGGVSVSRFRREIALAARLQHPHIVPLIAAGEIGGPADGDTPVLPFYTMPFVEGESLRARLAHGELPVAETLSILRDVARALEYAHGKGVAHRDIKPDNVLLAGRSAVITDFGVAKAISDASNTSSLTSVGVALGTPAYMAPEQAAADPATDFRADIYAFGAMAYEMLAGHPPFAGRSPAAMLAAHATETPTAIASVRPATPVPLAQLVTRCLEKRPGDRPQSATELVHALDVVMTSGATSVGVRTPAPSPAVSARTALVVATLAVCIGAGVFIAVSRWRGSGSASLPRSIAVLPFQNTSGDTAFDYLEDGITDHVRDALNATPGVSVKARSSSQQLKGRNAREIGARLGVGVVLQGTVSGSSTRLHVAAELVRTDDENALWSGTFEGRPDELVGMQDTITRAIIGRLSLSTPGAAAGWLASGAARGTNDAEAYDLLLRGRFAFDRTEFARAESFYRQALARDPRFARAQASLAVAQAALPLLGIGPLDSVDAEARRNAEAALALDSTVVEAYIAESNVLGNEMRIGESLVPLEKALKIDPNQVDLLVTYAQTLVSAGRPAEALTAIERAHERDPLAVQALGISGYLLGLNGRMDDGIARIKQAIDLDPAGAILHRALGFFLIFAGKPDSAVRELEAGYRLDSTTFGGRSNLILGYAAAGRWEDARSQRTLLEQERAGTSVNYEQAIADIAFGEYDHAMSALERSVAAREPLLWINSVPCDPVFDKLKADARFAALMQRIGARTCPAAANWPIPQPGFPPRAR